MQGITPSPTKRTSDFLFWVLTPILIVLIGLGVWSNHFESGFHADDLHTVVNNPAIGLHNVPSFFTKPQLSADQRDYADYRPLLTTSYAFDSFLSKDLAAQIFQIDTFAWFLLQLVAMYLLFLVIPGSDHRSALLAAALFGLHPVAAETVNYISRRGSVLGALGVVAGLVVWIVWPRRLPAKMILFDAVPQTGWDEWRRKWAPRINEAYSKFIRLPLFLYLIPVIFGLLADPATAVFAP
ncbi:MAG TPA: hypothetical protein VFC21_06995, partial [Bryobacteraceae bacterium]|nr:hypothetical protein [Bryobacteraceae bacterium]